MKAVFIGGGALRLLGILRGALARGVFDKGEINLYDLNVNRSEAMGRMLQKTPEYAKTNCKVTWGTTLPKALEGADVVNVVLMAGSQRSFELSNLACNKHGFIGSDNVSPSGAFLAVKGASILLPLAKKMEKYCPNAWLLNFANPVAVFSGMINNYTKIKALGVCQGFTNHQWDLTRLLGKDEQCSDYIPEVAGINHFSFIVGGSLHGKDLLKTVEAKILRSNWKPPVFQPWRPKSHQKLLAAGLRRLVDIYRELGVLVFSHEGDGTAHLYYDESIRHEISAGLTVSTIDRKLREIKAWRQATDQSFQALLNENLDQEFWDNHWQKDLTFHREDNDVFTLALTAIGGKEPLRLVSSRPNHGAIVGVKDRTVVEYAQILHKQSIRPAATKPVAIPASVEGIVHALAVHQTMLGDAIATNDPKLLAQALLTYPIRAYSKGQRAMYKKLIDINANEIPQTLRKTKEYL